MKLNAGDTAPDFSVEDIYGKPVRLKDYAGKKLMICFFRYAGCPWCNLAIYRLTEEYPLLHAQGLEVIVFLQSEKENIVTYIMERHVPPPPFTVVADPQRKIYELYGVELSVGAVFKSLGKIPDWLESVWKLKFKQGKIDGSLLLVPAQFLIGPKDFTVKKARYGANYADDMPFIEVQEFIFFGE